MLLSHKAVLKETRLSDTCKGCKCVFPIQCCGWYTLQTVDCTSDRKKLAHDKGLSLKLPNAHQKEHLWHQNILVATLLHAIEINFVCTYNQSNKLVQFRGMMFKASNEQHVLSDGALSGVRPHTIPHCSSCMFHEERVGIPLVANTEVLYVGPDLVKCPSLLGPK